MVEESICLLGRRKADRCRSCNIQSHLVYGENHKDDCNEEQYTS